MKTQDNDDGFKLINIMKEFCSINSNVVSMNVVPIKKAVAIIFTAIIITGVITPILALTLFVTNNYEVKPTIIISFGIFWGVSFYMIRILSWNLSGQEKLTLGKGKTTLAAKSNHFTFNKKIISSEKVVFSAISARQRKINGKEVPTSKLVIRNLDNLDDKVISDIEIPNDELNQLIWRLNSSPITNAN